MTPFIIYLVKMILCSGIFYLYYRIALYNRWFHGFNRWYLLSSVIASIAIPLIKIDVNSAGLNNSNNVIRLLNVVNSDRSFLENMDGVDGNSMTIFPFLAIVYIFISSAILCVLFFNVYKLWSLKRVNIIHQLNKIKIVQTDDRKAPFSFFNCIYWNKQMDINSDPGQRILWHEMVHVQERHSWDILFLNLLLVIFWCNPFYWLMRRELRIVHEFLADKYTIRDHDLTAFSEMILYAAFPRHQFSITSNFNSSSLKRRILMLTKLKRTPLQWFSRFLVIPVLIIVFTGFTFRSTVNVAGNMPVTNPISVVIDAGHGGQRNGATATDGTLEKDINLKIAKRILAMNMDKNIHITLTRETDVEKPLQDVVDESVKQHPDAFVSIHVNASASNPSGFEIYISNRNKSYEKQTQLLGSLLSGEIAKIYPVATELKRRVEKGIWVLDAPTINYPSLLIECGNLSHGEDLAFLKNDENLTKIAGQILNSIALYANARSAK